MTQEALAPQLLIAYDGSDNAADAIRVAAKLFAGAHAVITHVRGEPSAEEHAALARIAMPDAVIQTAAERYEREAHEVAQAVAARGRGIADAAALVATVEVHAAASAWRTIARVAEERDADVIVCGTRGRGPFARAVLGSTSSSLVHHVHRPLLVVPPGAGQLDGPMLIGYDGSDGARAAIEVAARLLPGRLALVAHAWPSPLEGSYAGRAAAAVPLRDVADLEQDLEAILAEQGREVADEGASIARAAGLDARPIAVEATAGAWRSLAATGRAEGAAVIVTGCRGRGALASTILGSVSSGLVHNAELPVLIAAGG